MSGQEQDRAALVAHVCHPGGVPVSRCPACRAALPAYRKRKADPNLALPFCVGCPDHGACMEGYCYLNGGPNRPVADEPAKASEVRDGTNS